MRSKATNNTNDDVLSLSGCVVIHDYTRVHTKSHVMVIFNGQCNMAYWSVPISKTSMSNSEEDSLSPLDNCLIVLLEDKWKLEILKLI